MTPAQLEHLKLIDAHLERLLALAEKRTPGEWGANEGQFVCDDDHGIAECYHRDPAENDNNAAFIASCAGNAEAGWKATRAAIKNGIAALNELGVPQPGYPAPVANAVEFITHQLESILATFPLKLIQKP